MHRRRCVLFCIFGYVTFVLLQSGILAQSCTSNGRDVGLDPIDRANDTFDPGDVNRLFIMSSEGGISCHGVITQWSFYKSVACETITFQVYRPDDPATPTQHKLIGYNIYDPTVEHCQRVEQRVDFFVPYLQQIPIQPGDIIGWVQETATLPDPYMIKYEEDAMDDVRYYDGCTPNLDEDVDDVCTLSDTVDRAYSLQASLLEAEPPTISNLPKTIDVADDEVVGSTVYIVYAQHVSNTINSISSNVIVMPVPLTLTLDPSVTDFSLTQNNPPGTGTDYMYQGTISIVNQLDYDRQALYSIPVTVAGIETSITEILTINITNTNDPHNVINLPANIDISAATTKAGDQIFQVELDGGTNNPFPMMYYIEKISPYTPPGHPEPPIVIDAVTGIVSITEELKDWWEVDTYTVDISVTDGVHTDGPHDLVINILDLRPVPVIDNLGATITVKENAVGGTMVFKVEVTSPSDESTYEFSLQDYNHHFYIDSKSGEIWLNNPNTLDYAKDVQHILNVEMKDDFRPAIPATLTINVGWVNEAPEFSPTEYWVSIPEACNRISGCDAIPPNTPTLLPWLLTDLSINGQDRDADNNIPNPADQITCNILPGFGSQLFDFVTTPDPCKQIYQMENIDVDDDPKYMSVNLSISIVDTAGLVNSGKIYISVYDINDNPPRFSPGSYSATINENTPGGVSLLTVSATDRDSGINAEFLYSLRARGGTNNPDGSYFFEVDPWTGVVSTRHPVDYEALAGGHKYIEFDAVATDKGEDPGPLSGSALVNVTINDLNDNHPEFVCSGARKGVDEPMDDDYPCFYNMEVKSIALNNTYIWTLTATDTDVITPTPKFYKLIPEDDIGLDRDAGNITVSTGKLINNHKYVVYALSTDEGEPELLSTPSVVRIESYSMSEYAVLIIVKVTDCNSFNENEFLRSTRDFITEELGKEWFVKKEDIESGCQTDRVEIIIYALRDNSTYLYENLEERKHFVPTRYELLKPLRKTLLGKPSDEYREFMDDRGFDVILVMPWRQIWLIDTLAGLIVLLLLILLFIAFWIALAVWCCYRAGICCFKKKPPVAPAWQKPATALSRRRPSVDTVHSYIIDQKNVDHKTVATKTVAPSRAEDTMKLWPN